MTSKDVARVAGVSQTTVSLVFNGRRDRGISEPTRNLVLATAEDMGYVPSAAARSLRSGRSEVVLCLLTDFPVSQATEEFKVELSTVLEELGYSCVYLHRSHPRQPLEHLWRHVHPAVVVAFGKLSEDEASTIRRSGIEVVDDVFGANSPDLIGLDQAGIGELQVRHLASRGHRYIGFAGTTDLREMQFSAPRQRGVEAALQSLDLPAPVIVGLDGQPETARVAVGRWRVRGVTAVAAFNDLTAVAVLHGARKANLSIPDDLAVVGVDDLVVGRLLIPPLTTVAINLDSSAAILAGAILRLIDPEKEAPPLVHTDAFSLVERETT